MDIGIAPCTEGAPMVHQDLSGIPADQKAELGLDKNRKKHKKTKQLTVINFNTFAADTAESELTVYSGLERKDIFKTVSK